jgi:hypothetical protein
MDKNESIFTDKQIHDEWFSKFIELTEKQFNDSISKMNDVFMDDVFMDDRNRNIASRRIVEKRNNKIDSILNE